MVEIIALVIALVCLSNSSPDAAILFVVVAAVAAVWRAYKANDSVARAQREMRTLQLEVQQLRTLAERAVRIAAETANAVEARPPQPTAARPQASPAAPEVFAPKPVEPPSTAHQVQEIPELSASVKAPPPFAPKIEPPRPVEPVAPKIESPRPSEPVTPKITQPEPPPNVVPPAPTMPPPALRQTPPVRPPVFASGAPQARPKAERVRAAVDMEEMLGKNWLSKIGVIMIVLAIASYGIYQLGHLGPLGKVGLSMVVAAALLAGGIYLERKERYRVLGRTGIGGGWALLFFTSYALNHVDAMRLIGSQTADAVLMLVVAGAMVAHTLRYRSQLVTGSALLLAYSTIALSHDTVYSLVAGAILALAVIAIVVKLEWYELEIFAILSSYGNHFYWLYPRLGENGAGGHPFPEFLPSSALLIFYWAAFRFSFVVRKIRNQAQEQLSTVAAVLNTILLLLVMKFQAVHPEFAFYALLVLGALEFSIGQLTVTKRRRSAFVVLTILGTALMLAAVPFRFSGSNVAILWLMGGEILLFAGILLAEQLFRRLGMLAGLVAIGWVLVRDLPRMLETRQSGVATPMIADGVLLFAMAAVFYANNTLLRLRWPEQFKDTLDDALLTVSSYPGAIALALACWAAFVHPWTAVAWGVSVFTVAVLGWMIKSRHLQLQSMALSLLSLFAVTQDFLFSNRWSTGPHHVPARIISLATIAVLFYGTAKFAQHRDDEEQQAFRGIFAAFGTYVFTLLIGLEVPDAWQALTFAVFAIALIEAARLTKYRALQWHTHAMAVCACGLAMMSEFSGSTRWHGVRLGLWKVIPVIAVLYFLGWRIQRVIEGTSQHVRTAYTWVGTLLGIWLIYLSADSHYVAAAWTVYAVALLAASRWLKWDTLSWQAFAIGIMSALQAFQVQLLESRPNVHSDTRLTVTLLVIVSLYAMAELLRLPERIRAIHSVSATGLAMTLAWYELSPVTIALGWALLGLAVYEYGAWRKLATMRWQAYAVLAGSFSRIFFANLTAGEPGQWLSTRVLTVLPIAAIEYYVFSREEAGTGAGTGRRLDPAMVFAYFGTGAVMTLLYFQIQAEWVVTAWAAMVIALMAIAVVTKQAVFAQQAVLMAVAVLSRGMFHNLFGGSYFNGSDWSGRFGVLGAAVALLFAALPLAFEYRKRSAVAVGSRGIGRWLAVVEHHAEQPIFFIAVALLTTMLAVKMDHGMVTLSWGVEAILIFMGALLAKERSFRLTGLLLLLLCIGKILIVDLWRFSWPERYLTLFVVGAILVAVSLLYGRYSERIREFL